jgi:RNA polymerase sigma factor (sigma-70 family)
MTRGQVESRYGARGLPEVSRRGGRRFPLLASVRDRRSHIRGWASVCVSMGMKQPFEKLVEQHGRTVLRVCRVILGIHDAEDAWSETFLAAMRAYPDLPDNANTEAWLVTIAHRKAIDVLRACKRQPAPVGDVPEAPTALGVPGSGDGDLWQAVGALPEKQRQAVAYHYVAGLAYAEIAAILGGTTDAARRAAADGIKNLRKNYPGATTEGAPS